MKRLRWTVAALSPVLIYLLAAGIGSLIPVNSDWRPPPEGVTIYITDNGYHTGLILPVSEGGLDLSLVFRPSDLPAIDNAGTWLIFGWGDREFYLNTPTWAEFSPRAALIAFVGSEQALLHVDHLGHPDEAYAPRPIRLTPEQYRKLVWLITQAALRGNDGNPKSIPGYGDRDVFYLAHGRYSMLRTCNNWTRDMLAEAGIRVGLWTPFSGGVMRWF